MRGYVNTFGNPGNACISGTAVNPVYMPALGEFPYNGMFIPPPRLKQELSIEPLSIYCQNLTTELQDKSLDLIHPYPCPLPSRERELKNRPSLEGRG